MKKLSVLALALGVALAYSVCRADDMGQKSKTVTLTGTLVDLACYLDDGDSGNDHMGMKTCGTECLKGGSPAGLVVDKNIYVLVFPSGAFADYVGKKVEINGDQYGTNLIPKKASQVNSDGSKKTINIRGKAMM